MLDAYQFSTLDDFDTVLLAGLEDGFFDPGEIEKYGVALSKNFEASKLEGSFSQAWKKFWNSFDDNEDEVLDGILASFKKGVSHITANDLSNTVKAFKNFGREKQAAELIGYYVENRDEKDLFDLDNHPFGGLVDDPDVRRAFAEKLSTFKDKRDPAQILLEMYKKTGWNDADLQRLAATPVEDYIRIFKSAKSDDLPKLISVCIQFDKLGGATDAMLEISKRAKEALAQIGREARINGWRVKRYGVDV